MSFEKILSCPDGPVDILRVIEPDAYLRVSEMVEKGVLPADTIVRLDSIGDGVPDSTRAESANLRWLTLMELDDSAGVPEHMSVLTRNLIFGEPPRALLSWDPEGDAQMLHTAYDAPFLVRNDLAEVIKERRVDEGKTVTEVPDDRRWRPPEAVERGQCLRIAHNLWFTLSQRVMPEWLETDALGSFYRPHKQGATIDMGEDVRTMSRRIVGAVALKITHIKDIFDEAMSEGVSGIGPVGKTDLRALLAEEYPELL